ncbi:hypothetical protein V1291_002680 [Nitrobacteraceae bacterium AZCC 1564]
MVVGRKLFRRICPLLAAGTVVLFSVSGTNAEIWCRRDFDRDNPICVFKDARDCLSAAVIMGGICERQKLGNSAAKFCDPSRLRSAKARRADRTACDAS